MLEKIHPLDQQPGLYSPLQEHDACGVGFVANINGVPSRKMIEDGLQILRNLTHRGAVGADPKAGDGAGILLQIPHEFMQRVCDFALPEVGEYAVGMIFMPQALSSQAEIRGVVERYILDEGQSVLGWRQVPVDNSDLGESVRPSEPAILQVFIGRGDETSNATDFERKLLVIRKQIAHRVGESSIVGKDEFYITSMSCRTLVYKGLLLSDQVADYFLDLRESDVKSCFSLVHQRFSTNTFPTWDLAHPFRMIAHNGEINTVRGNINWMAARRSTMSSTVLGDDLAKLWPLIPQGTSDSAAFDNALELLVAGGYSLAHAMMILIPEAWKGNPTMSPQRRAFYEYHAALMEPWDGPAAVAFTDGLQLGATLDRNGLRPARYLLTKDGTVLLASEAGVLDIDPADVVKRWRLQPGKMFLIDFTEQRIIDDEEIKQQLASQRDYAAWLEKYQYNMRRIRPAVGAMSWDRNTLYQKQRMFGYSKEDLSVLLTPMAQRGEEAIGSMGTDIPPAVMSDQRKHLAQYFKQNFAQVTNPPIDPIREELVMSLMSMIGPRPNLLDLDSRGEDRRLIVDQPILTNNELERVRQIEDHAGGAFHTKTLDICFPLSAGEAGMSQALQVICEKAESAVLDKGYNILILSDRHADAEQVPLPALLATSAVHHHLIRCGLRTETGIVVETGAAWEIHHFATLAGYGAEAINPYVAFDTIDAMHNGRSELSFVEMQENYIKAIGKGLKKVMSKMGISTFQSYCGAQIFDIIGLDDELVREYFTGTASTIGGIGMAQLASETVQRHQEACALNPNAPNLLDVGGDYAQRINGERHVWSFDSISTLQHATRSNSASSYAEFAKLINQQDQALMNLRGLFELDDSAEPVPLVEVEAASEIVKRFATGAMSFGSISYESHSNLAVAMNELGGKSNTGEGGELAERFAPLADGQRNPKRSAIKQVASGRFGVTTEYLVNADDIQIKMAQGAKPGEGGQLPGHKVSEQIARVRHSTAGVGLISPPPHHDIYSIEDLAQLIHDLKNVNDQARISVKLVSEFGVGTVAAGVSKAHADHVTISGFEGGTGASPLSSVRHAGSPWEIGLAETQQTLLKNNLRNRIRVQVDGGLRTGRDVVIGALLGADEFGFATAPLITQGCIMMRKCHLNTCPVGVATQDPVLRKKFTGKPEYLINYFFFIAEEVRQIMAALGYRRFDDMVGQTQRIKMRKAIAHWKAQGVDLSRMLYTPAVGQNDDRRQTQQQDHGLDGALDHQLIKQAETALAGQGAVQISTNISNVNRSFGAMLSGQVARRFGHQGLPADSIVINAKGIAGQSMGAWLAHGITINLHGEGNDYVGKGLSGGKLIIRPQTAEETCPAAHNIIVGNTVLYGAIAGECYFNGQAGERFAVRNSGASAVVEGVGDHGCEYMTGGIVVCLGPTGRNFAAGMSGGIAYIYDPEQQFMACLNAQMVTARPLNYDPDDDDTSNLLGADSVRLKQLISEHVKHTGSALGQWMLDDFATHCGQFIKVTPRDFARALSEKQQATTTPSSTQANAQQEVVNG